MSTAAKTRRERKAETRAALLGSAAKLFCRDGLQGTSVEAIAEDAGYTKGAFYSSFASKEELFLVMLDDRFAEQLDRLDGILAGEREPAEEARVAADEFIQSLRGEDEWRRLYFEFIAYAARNDGFGAELAERHRRMRARLADIVGGWAANFPDESPLPIPDIAAMIDFMADGYLLDQLIDPDLDERLYTSMMLVFFRGLQAMAAGWEPSEADLTPAAS